ncbi:Uncharacterized protein Fot_43051 [Forsythia ovata]|uniref:Uncharacterized protein n=1 Tax=Forsythia ovata TaxID=205694 RepID=A0ABD1RRU9_9LAMI
MELLKLAEMHTSRSHVLNCELYKVLAMKVDELRSMVGGDEDVDALRLENKDLREQLAFFEDARARAIYDITKAKTIQRACVQAQKTAELQLRSCQNMIHAKDKELIEVLTELSKAKGLLANLGVPGYAIPRVRPGLKGRALFLSSLFSRFPFEKSVSMRCTTSIISPNVASKRNQGSSKSASVISRHFICLLNSIIPILMTFNAEELSSVLLCVLEIWSTQKWANYKAMFKSNFKFSKCKVREIEEVNWAGGVAKWKRTGGKRRNHGMAGKKGRH